MRAVTSGLVSTTASSYEESEGPRGKENQVDVPLRSSGAPDRWSVRHAARRRRRSGALENLVSFSDRLDRSMAPRTVATADLSKPAPSDLGSVHVPLLVLSSYLRAVLRAPCEVLPC